MTSKSAFSKAEWQLVRDAPFWVQTAITAAEGRMSFVEKRLEGKALESYLEGFQTNNQLIKDVLAAIKAEDHQVNAKASSEDVEKTLKQIKGILESKATEAEVDQFNDFLLGAGNAIATASSEGLLSRGEKISEDEAKAMHMVANTLEATPAHQRQRAAETSRKEREETLAAKQKAEAEAAAKKAQAEAEARKAEEEREAREADTAERKAEYERKVREAQAERRQKEIEEAAAKRKAEAEAKKASEEVAAATAAAEAAAAAAAAAAAKASEVIHEVKAGETLSHIAMKYMGNANKWRDLYEANKDQIKNPSLIYPGQKLRIPQSS